MNFFCNLTFENTVVASISRTKRIATIWVRRPRMSAMPPKNSRREKSAAKAALPGHPVPFTQPMVFWMSFTLGQPCARKIAPSARRPTRHASSARTAAESAIAALFHLDHSDPRNAIEHVPRFVEDSVVPSQVAGVVVGQELQDVLRRSEAARVDELSQELGMVDDVVPPAEVGILVLERVEAVGTCRDDPRHPVPVEGLHVAHDHRLGQVFVAEAPRRIAGAFLLWP